MPGTCGRNTSIASSRRREKWLLPGTSKRRSSPALCATRPSGKGLLKEGVECLLSGDVHAGKILLRDYINATIGFEQLGSLTNKSPKSLMRMFGPAGNPQARNLFEVIGHAQKHEGVQLQVTTVR